VHVYLDAKLLVKLNSHVELLITLEIITTPPNLE
jgi:hypothetical protein